ncbi:MAG: ABC-2 transporter permease [Mycoplasmoidaceae bacterium]|nr:ABC-2 transporter permease [Mycoplasmoidaceae bacterium]
MSICQTFMGMVAGLFTAVLAIGIFKDTNEEGTELIVISKPISRFKIVMSKFVVFAVFCLLVNISTVIITMFTAFLPRTEPQFYVGLLISMFIGNAITFAIFGSISILLTLNFAKVGIIITNVIISLLFLIYQALTLFVFSTPLKVLSDQNMTAASYIIHERDRATGDYKENEVVYFEGSPLESGAPHPCQATN